MNLEQELLKEQEKAVHCELWSAHRPNTVKAH